MRTLSEHILDIVQNSIGAKATLIEIIVEEDKKIDLCSLIIKDNGCGMSRETLAKATNPFFTSRTTRKVGLGLPLLKQNAEAAGGIFSIESEENVGTVLKATFQLSNIDKPPLGDIWETLYLLFLSYENGELIYRHKTEKGEFSLSSEELKEALGGVSYQLKEIREGILELIKTNIEEIEAKK
ncbi:ATP-binding protein [Draconibacterium sp. IB214405]|uniref:ATP-binding protein n=1 Tax=Draconibacterium sp. IB214405 TaxID=3097352 RepID=UPI002A142073|nr:ATP-binding protein [Draconibacterium sp. IB214405]MDX8340648.1 ATP-binding protein [Draconibacterium sp. IB214405]